MNRHVSDRKKSPRAPSIALNEALERVQRIYEKEKRHAAPTEIIVQAMGYKSANNGAALAVLASIRYYGLLEKPQEGKLAIVKDFESYLYAPDDQLKRDLVLKWLRSPPVFADLLDRYPDGYPSAATMQFDLMDRGFSPASAASVIAVFLRSVEFAGLDATEGLLPDLEIAERAVEERVTRRQSGIRHAVDMPERLSSVRPSDAEDKIPVRLSGGRKAWLIVPAPLYEQDKERLKAQIDFLLTDEAADPLLD